MGPNADMPLIHRPNSGTRRRRQETAFQRHSGAATGMVVLWWQSRHETDSSPGSAIRSVRVGGLVMTGSSSDAAQILPSCGYQPVNQAIVSYPLRVSHTGKEGLA
jgi:hypothetical protein